MTSLVNLLTVDESEVISTDNLRYTFESSVTLNFVKNLIHPFDAISADTKIVAKNQLNIQFRASFITHDSFLNEHSFYSFK